VEREGTRRQRRAREEQTRGGKNRKKKREEGTKEKGETQKNEGKVERFCPATCLQRHLAVSLDFASNNDMPR
jgi:hypothetical protein